MHPKALAYVLTVVLPFVYAGSSPSGTKVCSGVIEGLCSQDFEVINSTYGIILPPEGLQTSTPFENDLIFKIVQPLSYGSAGIASTGLHGIVSDVAVLWCGVRQASAPGISTITNTLHAQVLVNATSSQGPSAFALQPPPAGKVSTCNIRVSPFSLHTKQQITAFIQTDAAPVFADSSMQSASFPIDGTMKTGSVLIDNLDKIRTSIDGYHAAFLPDATLHIDTIPGLKDNLSIQENMVRRLATTVSILSSGMTIYRAYMTLITLLAILAVDFGIGSRALAKCEGWGVELMDLITA
ncbi:hypothetical protein D9619_013277 [Psilocybe cf. subviscida]|uniref:Uncharacterized protein n=1 Tax=Psilocybe cf. subviscida TaxID=2480587 RepID=A0A8H5BU23_9AGAR|nr:hypothetical protein D9619_013277 [Psilocybe cf. subviscida]